MLNLPNLRALEDLVIAAIYAVRPRRVHRIPPTSSLTSPHLSFLITSSQGVLRAKLNQAGRVVEVEAAMGRDVRPSDLAAMIATLARWYDQTTQLVAMVDERIADVSNSMNSAEKERQGACAAPYTRRALP